MDVSRLLTRVFDFMNGYVRAQCDHVRKTCTCAAHHIHNTKTEHVCFIRHVRVYMTHTFLVVYARARVSDLCT